MQICVLGTGHVGLVTAAAFARFGHDVCAYDADARKMDLLQRGDMPFYEPGMEELVHAEVAAGRLRFEPDPAVAIRGAEAVFICVGTPPRADGEANLRAVEAAATMVAEHATGDVVVVEKSTVPAGTAERVAATMERIGNARFRVASNPEFLREGKAVQDALHPDRLLVGSDVPDALAVLRRIYATQIERGVPYIETDLRSAELAKHACNAFLSMKISYANALARICERADADVTAIADVMGSDPRIGRAFLDAGLGFGGYCFPKDVQAFERFAKGLGYDFGLLREVERINEEAVEATFARIKEACWNLESKRVALLGLSFKPDTDDVRFAPALKLARLLLDAGAEVIGFDPQAEPNAKREVPELNVAPGPYDAAEGAHCAVVCTEWDQVRSIDLVRLRTAMAEPVLIDGRNVFTPEAAASAGFRYYPTGRRPTLA